MLEMYSKYKVEMVPEKKWTQSMSLKIVVWEEFTVVLF